MSNIEIWNKIVNHFNQSYSLEENKLQKLWENIFSQYFKYNPLDNEIETQRSSHIGSTDRIMPDIILKKDNVDFAIIELKKNTIPYNNNYKLQLFSYLKQFKVSIGILICKKIYLYYYNYNSDDSNQQFIEIEFQQDNPLGEQFIKLFCKENLDIGLIKEFINNNIKAKDNLIKLKQLTTEEKIKEILLDYYQKDFDLDLIEKFLNEMQISIKHKSEYTTKQPTSPGQQITIRQSQTEYKLSPCDAIRLCHKYNVPICNYYNFANIQSDNYNAKYPLNTKKEAPEADWSLLLNDGFNKQLHILHIPANTFSYNDFANRGSGQIVLQIDRDFIDSHPQSNIYNKLFNYKIKTIDYSEDEI